MSKASEYAKIWAAANGAGTIEYEESGGRAHLLTDGVLALAGQFKDPLALARWIVDMWGEGDTALHVSPTGEITGTLPCGHGVESLERWGCVQHCNACRVRNPAP